MGVGWLFGSPDESDELVDAVGIAPCICPPVFDSMRHDKLDQQGSSRDQVCRKPSQQQRQQQKPQMARWYLPNQRCSQQPFGEMRRQLA